MSVKICYKKPQRLTSLKEIVQGYGFTYNYCVEDYDDCNYDIIKDELVKKYTEKIYNKQTTIRFSATEIQINNNMVEEIKTTMSKLGWRFVRIVPYAFITHHEASSYQVARTYNGHQEYHQETHTTEFGTYVENKKSYDTVYTPGYTTSNPGYELQFERDNVDEKYKRKSQKYSEICKKISDITFNERCSGRKHPGGGIYEELHGGNGRIGELPKISKICTCFFTSLIISIFNILFIKSVGFAFPHIVFFGASAISAIIGFCFIANRKSRIKRIATIMEENDKEIDRLYEESLRVLDEE